MSYRISEWISGPNINLGENNEEIMAGINARSIWEIPTGIPMRNPSTILEESLSLGEIVERMPKEIGNNPRKNPRRNLLSNSETIQIRNSGRIPWWNIEKYHGMNSGRNCSRNSKNNSSKSLRQNFGEIREEILEEIPSMNVSQKKSLETMQKKSIKETWDKPIMKSRE